MTDKVTNINEAVPTSSPLAMIIRRRRVVEQRRSEIRETVQALNKEANDLYREDQELAQAEQTVRKLMESK